MRDLLNDLSEGLSHPDPIRRAQIQMKKPLPKRFYTGVSVAEHEGGFAITLDGKMVRTPARQVLAVPTEALAQLVAAEWQAQGEEINPVSMPVTRLVNTALDGVAANAQAIFEDILRFFLQRPHLLPRRGAGTSGRTPGRALGSRDRLGGE
ncbi:chaperone required for assembly of F1-ATPase [Rhizobium leguminosarum]